MNGNLKLGPRRREETLAARQARVGIIANPRLAELPRSAPRDVWTRWPEMRAAKRRARAAELGATDTTALNSFIQSVRRSAPAPDPTGTEEVSVPEPSWMRRLMARIAVGSMFLFVLFYSWRVTWLLS